MEGPYLINWSLASIMLTYSSNAHPIGYVYNNDNHVDLDRGSFSLTASRCAGADNSTTRSYEKL